MATMNIMKDYRLWSPDRRVHLHVDGEAPLTLDLAEAARFLGSFGDRAYITDVDQTTKITSDEYESLVSAMQDQEQYSTRC